MSDQIVLSYEELKFIKKIRHQFGDSPLAEVNHIIIRDLDREDLTPEFLHWLSDDKIELWLRRLTTEGVTFIPRYPKEDKNG